MRTLTGRAARRVLIATTVLLTIGPAPMRAQRGVGQGRGRGAPPAGPLTPQAAAPIDVTGYWVSIIVDEWRFRVTPQKGDIPYLPLNNEARQIANAWDPAKDEAEGNQCKAYGAVGVMQRPGRLHITWENDATLRIDTDAGTQTRLLHFDRQPAPTGAPQWQGFSTAEWQRFGGGRGVPLSGGYLKIETTHMRPGY